jgi:AAHS family 4-hydroxybenzoate transporter-like MFS transporter
MKTFDVGTALDEGEWGGYQKLLVFATALTIVLDGLDNQLLGVAIPSLMREWGLGRPAFSMVLTLGLVGMAIGGAIGGFVGDRLGRRVALLASVVTFGVLTICIYFVDNLATLIVLRFFAGLGLGGAMPNAAALSSEYVPKRHRPFAVTLTVVCIPLGGSLAGFVGGLILPVYGWRMLFLVGGILPLVLAAALLKVLPESPRYLARRRERWPELRTLLGQLGHAVPADASFLDGTEKAVSKTSVRELFVPELRRDTLALCASFFCCLFTVYLGTNWVPSMLTAPAVGFDPGTASYGLTAFNMGGVVGAILGAFIIMRLGSRLAMLMMSAGAAAGAAVLSLMPIGPEAIVSTFAMLAWTGGLMNATQTTMYALAAHVYPTSIRSTGVGTAVAFGRIGGVLSPSVGSWALETGGAPLYFRLLAGTMVATFAALAAVRHHIAGASAARAATPAVASPVRH